MDSETVPVEDNEADSPRRIDSKAVWLGPSLAACEDWIYQLQTEEIDCLGEAGATLTCNHAEHDVNLTDRLQPLFGCVQRLQHNLEHGSGATLVRGFPLDTLSTTQAGGLFWSLVQQIGFPVSQTAAGKRLFDVRDAGFAKQDPRTRGPNTRKKLSFHTDRCDVIGFLCVRQAKDGGENHLVSSAALYNRIAEERPDLLNVLMQPYPYQRHNVDRGNETAYCYQPIFSFCEGHFAGSFLRVLIDRADASGEVSPLSAIQREALDYLEATAELSEFQHRFRMKRGDLLFLNNWTTFHRRTEFTDWPEPERKRHLLRVWLSVPNSRPIDTLFKENFGSTSAGAVRGGMRAESQ